jgi:hypothetical protein
MFSKIEWAEIESWCKAEFGITTLLRIEKFARSWLANSKRIYRKMVGTGWSHGDFDLYLPVRPIPMIGQRQFSPLTLIEIS